MIVVLKDSPYGGDRVAVYQIHLLFKSSFKEQYLDEIQILISESILSYKVKTRYKWSEVQ